MYIPVKLQQLRHSPHRTTWVKWSSLHSNNANFF